MTRPSWLVLLALTAAAPAVDLDIADAVLVPEDNSAATVAEARVFYATWSEGVSYNAGDVTVVSDDSAHSVTGSLFVLDGPLSGALPSSGTLIVALDEVLNDGEAYHLEWPAGLVTGPSGSLLVSDDHDWNILVSGTADGDGGPVPSVIATPDASASSDATIDHSVLLFYDPDVAGATPADRTTGMVLTIETLPSLGSLTLDGSPVTAGQDIAVTAVAAGDLMYTTSETDTGSDHFAYRWTDAAGSQTPTLWFEVGLAGGGSDAPSFDVSDYTIPFAEADRPLYDPDAVDTDIGWVDLYNATYDITHSGSMGAVTITVSYDDADRDFAAWDQLQYNDTLGGDVTMDATLDGVDGSDLKLFLVAGKDADDLENVLDDVQFRHSSSQFTADATRSITVTITEGGGSGGTVTTTHEIQISHDDSPPKLQEINDGTQSYADGATFIIDETGLELTVIAYDYEQQSVTVGLDAAGSIPINGTFDVVSTSTTTYDSSVDVPGPHSVNEIVIRYDPITTETTDTLDLELTDGDAATSFSLTMDIDPFDSGRPQLIGDPPLVTTATVSVHTYALTVTNLSGISEANCRFQGSAPSGISAVHTAFSNLITFTWTASGDQQTPVSFDYVLVDSGQAVTIPVTTVAIDPAVTKPGAKPAGLPPINN